MTSIQKPGIAPAPAPADSLEALGNDIQATITTAQGFVKQGQDLYSVGQTAANRSLLTAEGKGEIKSFNTETQKTTICNEQNAAMAQATRAIKITKANMSDAAVTGAKAAIDTAANGRDANDAEFNKTGAKIDALATTDACGAAPAPAAGGEKPASKKAAAKRDDN